MARFMLLLLPDTINPKTVTVDGQNYSQLDPNQWARRQSLPPQTGNPQHLIPGWDVLVKVATELY